MMLIAQMYNDADRNKQRGCIS